ncbi:helix-turn-helix domain-containing protein [Embleya sp. NPDC050154]|uniref:helix-turn-helix domain-containing protein n=1 Tax=unclassified Embleya TaxID=2699296 RepID=UPI0037A2F5EA
MPTDHDETPTFAPHNGTRLAAARAARGWTQSRLAMETNFSLAAIKAYERGARSLDRPANILSLARALKCHPTDITGAPYYAPGSDDGAVSAIKRELLRYNRAPRLTEAQAREVDLAELRARVAEANAWRQAAAMTRTGEVLPDLLLDTRIATHILESDDRREAYGLLCSAYEAAMQYLYKMGLVSDATLATERVLWAAERTEDPLRMLAARWYESGEYIGIGEHDEAATILDDGLAELSKPQHRDDPLSLSLAGAYHLKASLNSARAYDDAAAWAHWAKAEKSATELGGDRNDFELVFGPTNVAIWGVSLPVELGRGRDAVRRLERIVLPQDYSRERRSHFHIDAGRAHYLAGDHDSAWDAFEYAERLAPQHARMHPAVRENVRLMTAKYRRSGRRMEFARRVGVA